MVLLDFLSENEMTTVVRNPDSQYFSYIYCLIGCIITINKLIIHFSNLCKPTFLLLPIGNNLSALKQSGHSYNCYGFTLKFSNGSSMKNVPCQSLSLISRIDETVIDMICSKFVPFFSYEEIWLTKTDNTNIHDWYCFFILSQVYKRFGSTDSTNIHDWYCFFIL